MQGKTVGLAKRQAAWEQGALFAMGGTAYLWAEIAWRGATHWSMFFAGGLCFCLLVRLERRPRLALPAAAGLAAAAVTLVELAVGLACLRLWRLRVWDYRAEWGNLAGVICPKYSLLWYFLCLWLLGCLRMLRRPLCRALPAGEA